MPRQSYDLAIIGGGLIGCAIARDAVGRGLSVFLCEEGDLASGASSAELGLVHGDLRNLAAGRFSALRKNLKERELLRKAAPHLVRCHEFLLPYHTRMWSTWAMRAGLTVYDRARRSGLPRGRRLDLRTEAGGGRLHGHFETAFTVNDCQADSARLTILNALDARGRGAQINPRLRCVVAEREGSLWRLSLESTLAEERFSVRARALVNATGVRSPETAAHVIHATQNVPVRYLRSKAIYFSRRQSETEAYALPHSDGRVIYVMPQPGNLVVIGSEREGYDGDPSSGEVTRRDILDLCTLAGQYFREAPQPDDVVFANAALTALPVAADPDRPDHMVVPDTPPRLAPLYTVFGGTLTTHRLVAEKSVDMIGRAIKTGRVWTAGKTLPGGNLPDGGVEELAAALTSDYPFLGSLHARRLADTYGTRAADLMSGARAAGDLGVWFGQYLTQREVEFLCREEWARSAEDVLWRRSRLGLSLDAAGQRALEAWFRTGAGEEEHMTDKIAS